MTGPEGIDVTPIPWIIPVTTPLGPLWGGMSEDGVLILSFTPLATAVTRHGAPPFAGPLRSWLADYFAQRFRPPDFPLRPKGTLFQHRVWSEVSGIAAGETRTYGALATRLDTAPRAIGRAMAANPLPLLIPCHRVIAADGSIGGYSGGDGSSTKRWLLRREGCSGIEEEHDAL
ncbi:MAG: methylated-DNA--[protein]-cysteine S-methyltransferase [Magnetococcales bacterium]|nr:methylated-DNA--[protein]-cysteine S-methyltransferase [Magnetococcales bacterium]